MRREENGGTGNYELFVLKKIARKLHVPSALLWIQPATFLDIYYYYFNGYSDLIANRSDPSYSIELPRLPSLICRDLPSFFLPSNPYAFALKTFKQQFETLEQETKPRVLMNTFDALEPQGLKAIEKLNLVAIGPLIPSAYLDGKDPSDKPFGADLFKGSKDYIEWLNSKPNSSVVYVGFGSVAELPNRQMEAIANGLLQSRRPFLWVIANCRMLLLHYANVIKILTSMKSPWKGCAEVGVQLFNKKTGWDQCRLSLNDLTYSLSNDGCKKTR
ncbi:crocetin glucosyltransferase, chloroplastic-like [Telopea speciosissima]|uniref:crocetin glucosyltransferase, chloroplastic-like n=1 Tax=Telopea speciosissima TaxID=54955 RepID=UPI001CC4012D|nr:crocetin glucosyltransferase, chloroplastic-like [Telopea speciosissima]